MRRRTIQKDRVQSHTTNTILVNDIPSIDQIGHNIILDDRNTHQYLTTINEERTY